MADEYIRLVDLPRRETFDGNEVMPMSTGEETYGSTLQSIKSFMLEGIEIAAATTAISGKLNLSDLTAVKAAQNGLKENEVRFFVITDSQGKLPSSQKSYDVPSEVVRQMSLTTGNSIVDLALGGVSVDPIGVNVGDLIALTSVSVKLSDLAAAVGVSISIGGSLAINQYKIFSTNDAKAPNTGGSSVGVFGLLSPSDKVRINKVDGIEYTANDTRNWLNSVNNTVEKSLHRTRYSYGAKADNMLNTGVCAYTSDTIDGITANWTIFVDCSSDVDSGGYYHFIQTAICRDSGNLGDAWMRLGYYQNGGTPSFLPWKKLTN